MSLHIWQNSDGVPTSGFGFELTFRLQKDASETSPPTWPAALMQALARYVFQSENILCCGDHVSWHAPLDGSDSRLQHMLMAEVHLYVVSMHSILSLFICTLRLYSNFPFRLGSSIG